MPKKKKKNLSSRLNTFVSEFGKNVFSIDTRVLFCKYCETKVDSERRSSVIQHLKTEKHLRSVKRKENQQETKCQQLLTNDLPSKKSKFNLDLCKAMVSANIPLNKLSNIEFRTFLEVYSRKDVPTESVLRKFYLDDCYNEMMEKIRQRVFDRKIWVSLDETTDAEGRYIANVIIGSLEEDTAGPIFLLNTEALEKTNHSTVSKLFDKSLSILWPDGIRHDNVLLFLSDAAPYMVKCGKSLNALYSKMVHVTCAAHGLHRVSKEVQNQFGTVDKIVANVKKIFKKALSRIQILKNYAPDIPLPPEPIIT
uniref:CGG triplet repeat-binding protein 1 n=1 Tax=Sipha flava TaxID=143950 RepID=A0A2S2Q5L2_9HEMI